MKKEQRMKRKINSLALFLVFAVVALSRPALAETIFGLTVNNQLIRFDSATPGVVTGPLPITGLSAGTTLVGIDFRPATPGGLAGVGQAAGIGTVYTIDLTSGVATPVNTGFALTGTAFGTDFNPVPNALRIVSDQEQNLRIVNGGTGAVNVDNNLTFDSGNPNVVGAAYSNNIPGGAGGQTTLFVIDSALDRLLTQGSVNFPPGTSPKTGQLFDVGPLGFNTSDLVGFDISGVSGTAFASLTSPTGAGSQLFTINLGTGAATLVGTIGSGTSIRGISVITAIPEPSKLSLLWLGLLTLTIYRWGREFVNYLRSC